MKNIKKVVIIKYLFSFLFYEINYFLTGSVIYKETIFGVFKKFLSTLSIFTEKFNVNVWRSPSFYPIVRLTNHLNDNTSYYFFAYEFDFINFKFNPQSVIAKYVYIFKK